MAESKKRVKQVRQIEKPKGNSIGQGGNPDQYYSGHPAWNFASCDKENWSIYSDEVREIFWDEILPHIQGWETQTWKEILLDSKKQNHSIDVTKLNKKASKRLVELYVEAESLVSLRLTGAHRIYGYMKESVFNILWIDLDYGDNGTCVCQSHKKHT